jgi:hypothetical protein
VIFLNSGTSATAGKLNSTIIKGYKKILGKFGEIQREFVDVYSPDSDNYCRESGGGHHCGTMVRRSGNPPRTFNGEIEPITWSSLDPGNNPGLHR